MTAQKRGEEKWIFGETTTVAVVVVVVVVAISISFLVFFFKNFLVRPVWPDLPKFRHFGKLSKVFGYIWTINLVFGQILILLWQILYAHGQFFDAENGRIFCN